MGVSAFSKFSGSHSFGSNTDSHEGLEDREEFDSLPIILSGQIALLYALRIYGRSKFLPLTAILHCVAGAQLQVSSFGCLGQSW
jgi:hypothetical protein